MRLRGLTVFAALALCVSVSCRRAPARTSALDDDILRSPGAWLREEPVRLLKDYVQLDTTESRGEREGVEFAAICSRGSRGAIGGTAFFFSTTSMWRQ